MRVCGIVAEYDPFHKGHFYQLNEAKKKSQADYMICVISTAFTQRGLPGLFSTLDRAAMALNAGADLVLAMPVSYSCAQANRFAMGGVGILDALGVVSHISFGIESESLLYLNDVKNLMLQPSSSYTNSIKEGLHQGKSFVRAQGEAIAIELPFIPANVLNQPNFNLAVSYLQALSILHSQIEAVPVIRQGNYHDTKITSYPSATAVRSAILRGDWPSVEEALPLSSYSIVKDRSLHQHLHLPDALDKALLSMLLDGREYSRVLEMTEGLDSRMIKYAKEAKTRNHLIQLMKTKRYPYARISRALSQSFLCINKQPLKRPGYARLMGFRKTAEPLLHIIGKNRFPLISRPAQFSGSEIKLDMHAEQLWYIGSNQPAADAFRQKPVILM